MTDLQDIERDHGPDAALELLLLRQRIAGGSPADAYREVPPRHDVSLAQLAARISAHGLGGILSPVFPADLVSHPDMAQLHRSTARKARYNLLLLSEMTRLQELLAEKKLSVVFVKGLLLSHQLFGDFTTRPASDLDMLVQRDEFAAVRDLLISEGYTEHYPFPLQYLEYFLEHQREAAFSRTTPSGVKLHVELQWSVLPSYFPMPYGNDYFFKHTVATRIGNAYVTTLAPTQHLLLLLAHHGAGDLWRNLRHLADIGLFIQKTGKDIDWSEVEAQVNRWRIRTATACGFGLTDALVMPLDSPLRFRAVSPSLLRHCTDTVLSVPMLPKQRTHRATLMQQLRLCDSFSDRISLLVGFLKRYASPGMEELALIRLPRVLFPAYLVIRQFRFLYRGRLAAAAKPREDGT